MAVNMMGRTLVAAAALALAATAVGGVASADDAYPNHPIEFWVGYSAGSGADTQARLLVPYLSKALGQPLVVVNKDGAGGIVMWTELAHATPDGYTIGLINQPALAAGAATIKLAFDPVKDLQYIGNASADPVTITFNPQGKFKNLADVIAAAKASPGEVTVGITGRASHDYLTARSIEKEAGVKFKFVVFDGSTEAINALMGGHIDLVGMILSTAVPFYKQGQLGMLGISTDARVPDLPDVPTFKEQGINVFGGGALNYKAVGGPAGMPADVVAKLTGALKTAVADPDYDSKLAAVGSTAQFIGGDEMAKISENYTTLAKEFLANPE